jgi:retron-type reverse transcriptase
VDLLEALFEQDIWENVIDKGADKTIPLSVLRKWCHVDKRLELLNKIIAGEYNIKPPTLARIPKDNGKYREIYVNTADDRVVLAAVNQALYKLFDYKLSPACKAYREGHSCAKTVQEAVKHKMFGYKLDLSKYFDSVPHEVINKALAELDTDSPLEQVLYKYYNDDTVYQNHQLIPRFKSLAQGCAVASFLANYILTDVDNRMMQECLYYCRYSDDMLLLCEDQQSADKALAVLKQMLDKLGLSLNPDKVEAISPLAEFKFLGFGILGDTITISQKDFKLKKAEVKHACRVVETNRKISKDKKLRAAIKAVQKVFFSTADPSYGWLHSKAMGINNFERIGELDAYCKDCIRAAVTSSQNYTHNIHTISNEQLSLAGYVSLVHMAKLVQIDKSLYETEHLLHIQQHK